MNDTESRPLSPFWSRVLERAKIDATDWGLEDPTANFAATVLYHACSQWNTGEGGHVSTRLMASLLGVEPKAAAYAIRQVEELGLIEIIDRGGGGPGSGARKLRWSGPSR